jgi:hypothetical protein
MGVPSTQGARLVLRPESFQSCANGCSVHPRRKVGTNTRVFTFTPKSFRLESFHLSFRLESFHFHPQELQARESFSLEFQAREFFTFTPKSFRLESFSLEFQAREFFTFTPKSFRLARVFHLSFRLESFSLSQI